MVFKDILRQRAKKLVDIKALKKYSPYEIIIKPLFTEKTHDKMESMNKYTFKVHSECNKNDVRQAIKTIYNADVQDINMINVHNKGRNNRKLVRRAYKKAVITLKKWEKIELVK